MIKLEDLKKSKKEMLDKAYELGLTYEERFGGCAPGCLLACMEVMNVVDENLYKASTGFSGGVGVTRESQCGALSGGIMFLGLLFGRSFLGRGADIFDHSQHYSFDLAEQLKDKFDQEYESFICKEIHMSKLGKTYRFDDEKELEKFMKEGGRKKCSEVVALGAKWTLEIAFKELEKPNYSDNRLLYHAEEDYKRFMEKHKK